METLLIFVIIAAIQMIAAYSKQKKAAQKYTPPPEATTPIFDYEEEPEYDYEKKYEFEPEHKHEHEPKHEPNREPPIHATDVVHHALPAHPVIVADKPKAKKIINHKFDLKDPGHGIIWAAILHEPRYKVKWKQR